MNLKINSNHLLLFALALMMGCSSKDVPSGFDCTKSTLALTSTLANPTSCTTANGSITPNPTGGEGPYQFALDAGAYASVTAFNNLGAGSYVLKVKDKNGCEKTQNVTLTTPGSSVVISSATPTNTSCGTSTGSIAISATGTGSLTYSLNSGAAVSSSTFSNLAAGTYSIKVTDGAGCSTSQGSIRILNGTSYASSVQSIIQTNCAISGCHVSGTGRQNFSNKATVIANASTIKSRTGAGSMPPTGKLPQAQIDLIACWVDDGALDN
ncbi:MAG: hypothetical protein ACK5RG_14850 [Cyclobacteriaceae bacterium]|jgi:hypothetical protein|nr:hypothetical protein [Flammeovirgaceae bacterium]